MNQIIANKYQVVKKLGEGGFGSVFLVRHLELGIFYAIKVIKSDKGGQEDFVERFRREAMVLSKLLHPNSIPLRDFGRTTEGHLYMAMDFCQGKSLQQVLEEEGALDPQRVISIVSQILPVMVVAHSLGIVHRDLKPDNIMLEWDQDGQEVVKVLDFGIARLAEDLHLGSTMSTVTQHGAIIGTPMYMSPEQARGEAIDGRSDVYSLGMVMYHLLTGQAPFAATSAIQILMCQMEQHPASFEEMGCSLPRYLENIVYQATEKNPQDRFQTAQEFLDACQSAQKKGGLVGVKRNKTLAQRQLGKKSTQVDPKGRTETLNLNQGGNRGKGISPVVLFGSLGGIILVLMLVVMFTKEPAKKKDKKTLKDQFQSKVDKSKDRRKKTSIPTNPEEVLFEKWQKQAREHLRRKEYREALQWGKKALSIRQLASLKGLVNLAQGHVYYQEGISLEEKGQKKEARDKYLAAQKLVNITDIRARLDRLNQPAKPLNPSLIKKEYVVASRGGGDYKSLKEAVQKVPSGSRLVVREGQYAGGVVINKSLEIIGQGNIRRILLYYNREFTLAVRSGRVQFKNLAFVGSYKTNPRNRSDGLYIEGGEVTVTSCAFAYYTKSAIVVKGGKVELNHLRVTANIHGIVTYNAQVKVSNGRIYGNGHGMLTREKGSIEVLDTNFFKNQRSGLTCQGESVSKVVRCLFYENQSGFASSGKAQVHLNSCRFYHNHHNGVLMNGVSRSHLKNCSIYENKMSGAKIIDQSQGEFHRVHFKSNLKMGIYLQNQAQGKFFYCHFVGNRHSGLTLVHMASATWRNSESYQNTKNGIHMSSTGQLKVHGGKIGRNGEWGVFGGKKFTGYLEEVKFASNGKGVKQLIPGTSAKWR